MKKIVIFGSYNGSSVGDTALLLGLISSINRVLPNCNITVMTAKKIDINSEILTLGINLNSPIIEIPVFYNKSDFYGIFGKLQWFPLRIYQKIFRKSIVNKRQVKKALKNADHLLIGGGNLIMDLFPDWPQILDDIISLAKGKGVKYSFIGVGAGPLNTGYGKEIFANQLKQAFRVYFRDEESLKLCEKELNIINSDISPDCVFGIDWPAQTNENKTILLNVASVFGTRWPYKSKEKYTSYIKNIYDSTISIMEELNISKIVIYNTNYPLDEEAVLSLLPLFQLHNIEVHYVEGALKVGDLLCVLNQSSIALITRLHAGLLAYVAGCRVFAIAYQPKVEDVLGSIGITENIINIEDFIKGDNKFNIKSTNNDLIKPSALKNKLDIVLRDILT